ncbi:MAG: antibiotic biosynthesis monooxygenase family protein [Steroidobacteraceae bacterium]
MWKGRATAVKAGDYARHVTEKVFPQIRSIPGHRGAYLLRRSVGNSIEFLVLTLWASMDAIRRFAGSEPDKAVVEPAARAVLSEFEEVVTHYELVAHTDEEAQQSTG